MNLLQNISFDLIWKKMIYVESYYINKGTHQIFLFPGYLKAIFIQQKYETKILIFSDILGIIFRH